MKKIISIVSGISIFLCITSAVVAMEEQYAKKHQRGYSVHPGITYVPRSFEWGPPTSHDLENPEFQLSSRAGNNREILEDYIQYLRQLPHKPAQYESVDKLNNMTKKLLTEHIEENYPFDETLGQLRQHIIRQQD